MCRARVYHFYLPIFFYLEDQLKAHTADREQQGLPHRPLVFGISAPQACVSNPCADARNTQSGHSCSGSAIPNRTVRRRSARRWAPGHERQLTWVLWV
jgi:hypothetical protein